MDFMICMENLNQTGRCVMNNEKLMVYHLGKMSEFLGTDDLLNYYEEIESNTKIFENFSKKVIDIDMFTTKSWKHICELGFFRVLMYVLVRWKKPRCMIETGVLHGMTTDIILNALNKNSIGKLISIDLPSYFEYGPSNKDGYNATLPKGKEPGWLIDEVNKPFWELILGSSNKEGKKAFIENNFSIFIHDSDHTYENMFFELELAFENIEKNGIIVCDNIENNTAFYDFCRYKSLKFIVVPQIIGLKEDNSQNLKRYIGVAKKGC